MIITFCWWYCLNQRYSDSSKRVNRATWWRPRRRVVLINVQTRDDAWFLIQWEHCKNIRMSTMISLITRLLPAIVSITINNIKYKETTLININSRIYTSLEDSNWREIYTNQSTNLNIQIKHICNNLFLLSINNSIKSSFKVVWSLAVA